MARPQKQTVDYFPHYAGASDGKTMFILQSRFGNDGYAFWFKLLEIIALHEGHYYDYRKSTDWQFLLAKTGVSADIATQILETLMDVEAIDRELNENKIIWIQKFVDNLADLYKRRKIEFPRKPVVSTDNNSINDNNNAISASNNPQSKVNKSKVNKSKVNKSIGQFTEGQKKLFDILLRCPAIKGNEGYKMIEVCTDYPGLNYELEFKKFTEWWPGPKGRKKPWATLRNWLEKAQERGNGKAKGHFRETPEVYSKPPTYDD